MEVILLENVRNLGRFGDKVKVAGGYGRNFLIPFGKAVPANSDNLARFEAMRADLQQKAAEKLEHAKARAEAIAKLTVEITAKASDEGKLYGSVGTAEIAEAITKAGAVVKRQEVILSSGAIREAGDFEINLILHAEVNLTINLKIIADKN